MHLQNYLPTQINFIFLVILFLLFLFTSFLPTFFFFLFYLLLLFLFRRKKTSHVEFKQDEFIFSSSTGNIFEILTDANDSSFGEFKYCVKMKIGFWNSYGLLFPFTGVLQELKFEKRYQGKRRAKIDLLFKNSRHKLVMEVIPYYFSRFPQFSILSGDRGKQGISFGFLPFGGTLLLYLTEDYKLLVSLNNKLMAGVTPIARLRD